MSPGIVVRWAAPDPADRACLDPLALARMTRFRDPADAARFATVRRLARDALNAVAKDDDRAGDAQFVQVCRRCGPGDHGRPEVINPAGWHLSMAHSGHYCVVAVSRNPVGIDVECLGPRLSGSQLWDSEQRVRRLAERIFGDSAAQHWWGSTSSAHQRRDIVAAAWVRLEAIAKLDGRGLEMPGATGPSPSRGTDPGPGTETGLRIVAVELGGPDNCTGTDGLADYRCVVASREMPADQLADQGQRGRRDEILVRHG